MAVTTRDYSLTDSAPVSILNAMGSAFSDLGWAEGEQLGYLLTFTNTPGSVVSSQINKRYLVSPTAASTGTGALFDVLRTPYGGISAVTLVTGGSNYSIKGSTNGATGATTSITLSDTTTAGFYPGMVVTKLAGGTGTLPTNTVIVSITNTNTFVIDQTPTVALSNASILIADVLTLPASLIGGTSYITTATAASGATTMTVIDPTNIQIGQHVTGTNIASLVTVTAVTSSTITISKATLGTITSSLLTFSDEIIVTASSIANDTNLFGTITGLTLTNVPSSAALYVGQTITITSGTGFYPADGRIFISAIAGTGPYTITLRNAANTFRGFQGTGNVTFKASKDSSTPWFYYDNFTAPQSYAFGVIKIKNSVDRLGSTFWAVYAGLQTTYGQGLTFYMRPMTGFNPATASAQGVANLDWLTAAVTTVASHHLQMIISSSWYVPMTLKVRQSAIDTNFATFSFYEDNNNRNPFFMSKFNNSLQPWSLNDVFLGGVYEVFPTPVLNTNDVSINFRTRLSVPKRQAEAGYGNYNLAALSYTNTYFRSTTGNRIVATPISSYDNLNLYSRQTGDIQTDVVTTTPVYKNVPICPSFVPVPYYLPADFVLIEIPWANPAIRDTVTVSGSEIYTIIQLATNPVSYTALALAARTT